MSQILDLVPVLIEISPNLEEFKTKKKCITTVAESNVKFMLVTLNILIFDMQPFSVYSPFMNTTFKPNLILKTITKY